MHFTLKHPPVPIIDARFWSFTLRAHDDLTRAPLSIGYADLLALPAHTVKAVIVRPPRAANDRPNWHTGRYRGAAISDLLAAFGGDFTGAVAHAVNGVTCALPLADLHDALLAYEHDDQALTPEQGAPVRLIVPHATSSAMLKWITRIDLTYDTYPAVERARFVTLDRVAHAAEQIIFSGTAYVGDGLARVRVAINGDRGMIALSHAEGLLTYWQIAWSPPLAGMYHVSACIEGDPAAATNQIVQVRA